MPSQYLDVFLLAQARFGQIVLPLSSKALLYSIEVKINFHNIVPSQVLLDSVLIYTYDASLEYKSPVHVTVNEYLTQSAIDGLRALKNHNLQILVENMGRTNIGWDLKKLRKGNICTLSEWNNLCCDYYQGKMLICSPLTDIQ